MANPIDEHFVGVAHTLAQMHELEPRFNGECLQESPGVGDVFISAPGIGTVAPSRMSQFVECSEQGVEMSGADMGVI
jgi:hypothetical protein